MFNEGRKEGQPERKPFHYVLEFPEVLEQGGFNAIIGNPPFRASRYLSSELGSDYLKYLQTPPYFLNGQADLCAAFAMRAFWLLHYCGLLGMIVTKTISEGDTRDAFLVPALSNGGKLVWVNQLVWWPGDAQVVVSLMVLARQRFNYKVLLDGKEENEIDSTFSATSGSLSAPKTLTMSSCIVGKGVGLGADYFILDPVEGAQLHGEDQFHIRRYISGTRHNAAPDGWGWGNGLLSGHSR